MFQDRLLDPSSKVKQPKESWTPWPLKFGPTGYPEKSGTTNQCCATFQNSRDLEK